MKFIQIRHNHSRVAQDLLEQTTYESDVKMVIISELYRNRHGGVPRKMSAWFAKALDEQTFIEVWLST